MGFFDDFASDTDRILALFCPPDHLRAPLEFKPFDIRPRPDTVATVALHRMGGVVAVDPYRIVQIVQDRIVPTGPGAEAMRADGWCLAVDVWHRWDGGRIDWQRQASGRYAERLPTNRRRKREQAKARRRGRKRGRQE